MHLPFPLKSSSFQGKAKSIPYFIPSDRHEAFPSIAPHLSSISRPSPHLCDASLPPLCAGAAMNLAAAGPCPLLSCAAFSSTA